MMKRMQGTRKLILHRETLAPLSPAALRQAPGGLHVTALPKDPTASANGTCATCAGCVSVNYLCSA